MSRPIASPLRRAAAVMLAFVALACGSDSSTGARTLAGTYTLQSVDGQPLPVTRSEATTLGTVTVALAKSCCTVALDASGGFTRSLSATASQGFLSSAVTASDRGTYTQTSDGLRFISTSQRVTYIGGTTETATVDTTFATVASGRITFAGDATTFVTGALVFVK